MKSRIQVSIVAPVLNEESGIIEFVRQTFEVLSNLNMGFEILIVDDGSTDHTIKRLIEFRQEMDIPTKVLRILRLTKNFGHQNAMLCGLENANGDAIITLDADLQDPPILIEQMIQEWLSGADIVIMRRKARAKSESYFKRVSAKYFYRLATSLADDKAYPDTGDFRLLSKRANRAILAFVKNHGRVYLRGLIPKIGMSSVVLYYDRADRREGKTKFNLSKMIKLGIDGIISTSLKPLYRIIFVAILSFFVSTFYSCWILVSKIVKPEQSVSGYASLLVFMLWGFSVILFLFAVLFQYLISLIESLRREPRYLIEEEI